LFSFGAHFLSLRCAQRTLRAGNRAFRSNSSALPPAVKPPGFPLQSLARPLRELFPAAAAAAGFLHGFCRQRLPDTFDDPGRVSAETRRPFLYRRGIPGLAAASFDTSAAPTAAFFSAWAWTAKSVKLSWKNRPPLSSVSTGTAAETGGRPAFYRAGS
jgi:hypothetical protein